MKKEKKPVILDEYETYIRNLISRNLKRIRGDRRMSQMELAAIANLSCNFINEIENEKKSPSIESIAKLVKALGVEPFLLFAPEIMFKTSNAEMIKAELNSLNITVADINTRINRYIINASDIEPKTK